MTWASNASVRSAGARASAVRAELLKERACPLMKMSPPLSAMKDDLFVACSRPLSSSLLKDLDDRVAFLLNFMKKGKSNCSEYEGI
jgi:hypothetical protein